MVLIYKRAMDLRLKLLIIVMAATMTGARNQVLIQANRSCLSEESYKNISHFIKEDTLLEMKKELSNLKGTLEEELERIKMQQDQLIQSIALLTNKISLFCNGKSGTDSPIPTGMTITEDTLKHGDSSTISSSFSPISSDIPAAENIKLQKELYNAARDGDLTFINVAIASLSSSGLDLNWRNPDNYGYTALHTAAQKGNPSIVGALLDAGADPDVQEDGGRTPMNFATYYNRISVLRLLLEHKYQADVNLQDMYGMTPVHIAGKESYTGALELLLANGGDPNKAENSGKSPLITASEYDNVEIVRMLIQAGAHVNYVNPRDGSTALHMAAWNGEADVVELLLAHGSDSNKVDNYGYSPLLKASSGYDNMEAVRMLIQAGANVNYVNPSDGFTALQEAATRDREDVVRLLLQNGAEKNLKDNDGKTAGDKAVIYDNYSVARLIYNY